MLLHESRSTYKFTDHCIRNIGKTVAIAIIADLFRRDATSRTNFHKRTKIAVSDLTPVMNEGTTLRKARHLVFATNQLASEANQKTSP